MSKLTLLTALVVVLLIAMSECRMRRGGRRRRLDPQIVSDYQDYPQLVGLDEMFNWRLLKRIQSGSLRVHHYEQHPPVISMMEDPFVIIMKPPSSTLPPPTTAGTTVATTTAAAAE